MTFTSCLTSIGTEGVIGIDDAFCQCITDDEIAVGDSLVGFYTYDTTAPDEEASPYEGKYSYQTPPHRMVVYHENYVFSSDPDNAWLTVELWDSVNTSGWDRYRPATWSNLEDPFQPFQKLELMSIILEDHTGTALVTDSLIAPNLDDWPDYRILDIYGDGYDYRIIATVTSMRLGPPTGASSPRARTYVVNYPNPFNPSTMIRFGTTSRGEASLYIYDVKGRRVRTLLDGALDASREHVLQWDGRDAAGNELPSGVYLGVLRASGATITRKLVLLR